MAEYVLEIVEGPEVGRQVPVRGTLEIGRDPEAGLVLDSDELVSRRHVRLEPVEDGVRVEDLESRNGTFVNGDEIHSPAHLSPGGQLLVGVTLLELRTPAAIASGATSMQAAPAGLTTLRRVPTAKPMEPAAPDEGVTTLRQTPGPLARPESRPDYVPDDVLPGARKQDALLSPLLDVHTKSKAKTAPLAIFVLVAFVVFLYFALLR